MADYIRYLRSVDIQSPWDTLQSLLAVAQAGHSSNFAQHCSLTNTCRRMKPHICGTVVTSILTYACETRPLGMNGIRASATFGSAIWPKLGDTIVFHILPCFLHFPNAVAYSGPSMPSVDSKRGVPKRSLLLSLWTGKITLTTTWRCCSALHTYVDRVGFT